MPQSLVKNYIHITFTTKNRQMFISETFEKEIIITWEVSVSALIARL